MGKSILNDSQKIQLKDFCKQEKSASFIQDYFKTNYQIDLPGHAVYSMKTKLKKGTGKKVRKNSAGATEGDDIVTIAKEIAALPKQIEEMYLKVFKQLRGDLIRARGRAQAILGEPEEGGGE